MSTTIEATSRRQIAAFLPDAIMRALTSYQKFIDDEKSDNPKDFHAHHSACKIAVAHIELLLKLAKWADLPDPNAQTQNDHVILTTLFQEAEDRLAEHQEHYGAIDGEWDVLDDGNPES